jgi:ComF family protein
LHPLRIASPTSTITARLRRAGRALHALSSVVGGQCAVCHGWCRDRVCDACRSAFTPVGRRCDRCGIGLASTAPVCGECVVAPPAFTRTVAAVDYAFPWSGLIGRFKFAAALDLADVLAATMARASAATPASCPDLLLPVPLGPGRLRERGYNQAWELARRLARRVGVPADASLLLRIKDTAAQSTLLPGERESNLAGAFAVEPRRLAEVRGLTVAVVDDVMTTGATADEAARTLLRAGASEVHLWVLARTPAPGNATRVDLL